MKSKWIYEEDTNLVNNLSNNNELSGISPMQLKILINRGIKTKEDILSFLYGGLNNLHDTRLMKDAEKAVDVIIKHINMNHTIVFHADYDSDGGHAGAVGVLGLKKVGVEKVHVYANDRFTQGYGIVPSSVDEILDLYPETKLIITVDNGIMAFDGIAYAKSKGLDVVVTDHHEPDEAGLLPVADAIVDPHQTDCNYPFKHLCGTGVIFKILMLLYYKMGHKVSDTYEFLDLVAMGTVGDVVPIIGENRILVKEGLKRIQKEERYVFEVFRKMNETQEINSHFTLGFMYVPMINAVGRLEGKVDDIFKMYLSQNRDEIESIAKKLFLLNATRKDMTTHQAEVAEKIISTKYGTNIPKAIVVWDDEFTEGIVGLVAGRLKEKYNRPVVVFAKSKKGHFKGSARSIDGYHIKQALTRISDKTISFGGHEKAGGLSVTFDKVDAFESAFITDATSRLSEEDLKKKYVIDDVLTVDKLDIHIVDEIKELEPYGEKFSTPVLAIKAIVPEKPYYMGKEGTHARFSTTSPKVNVILWREALAIKQTLESMAIESKFVIKALGYPSVNVYKNEVKLQFIVNNDNYKIYPYV